MTFREIFSLLAQVRYKPDWILAVAQDYSRDGAVYLQWRFPAPCCRTGLIETQYCRKWYLSPFMTDSELVQTAFAAALAAEEHECREVFSFAGKRIFNPHISVHALMSICDTQDARPEVAA